MRQEERRLAGSLRLVMRWFAADAPYPWFGFATRFRADRVVGVEFFKAFAKKLNAGFQGRGTQTGLMNSLDDLRSDRFDPARVHPTIRAFYEQTTRFDMEVTIWWNPLVYPFGVLYQYLIARGMENLVIPLNNEALRDLDSWLELIDLDDDGDVDFRCWLRVTRDSRIPIYVGAYKTYTSTADDFRATYISVAFPIPMGALTTVLTPLNLDDNGLLLTTHDERSSEAGVYLVFPHARSFSMTPALGLSEQFQLQVDADGRIQVQHDCHWLGVLAFQMKYEIRERRPRESVELKKAVAAASAL